MKFEWKDGLIWVTFTLEYEGTKFTIDHSILDTGSATTAVDIHKLDK